MNREKCAQNIISEDYMDFIYEYNSDRQSVEAIYQSFCAQFISNRYVCLYVDENISPPLSISNHSYTAIPKLYGLMDERAPLETGAIQLQQLSGLGLTGRGVLVGIIDTGIQYTNPLFRDGQGESRIKYIWDQTLSWENYSTEVPYGREFTWGEINEAIHSDNPYELVPHVDDNGHGTFIAGAACASRNVEAQYVGTAPQAAIAVVKLKPAKKYLREYFMVEAAREVYQENDIMFAVKYLVDRAQRERMPLVLLLGAGTSQGDHQGGSPLCQFLEYVGSIPGNCVVVPAGNEAIGRLHYKNVISSSGQREAANFLMNKEYDEVELNVEGNNSGFTMELWGQTPDLYSIAIASPLGEVIQRIPARVGISQTINFLLDETRVFMDYRIVESANGAQLVQLRFEKPTEGIWRLRIYGNNILNGQFDIWLPLEQFTNGRVYFLEPDADITVTEPGNAAGVITIGAYEIGNGAMYIRSGRGYSRLGGVKPELVAPGMNVSGPNNFGEELSFTTRTGTCIAAALTAGVCALLLEWGIVKGREPYMKTMYIKNYLIRGATREGELYPNQLSGYGKINAYNTFRILISD